MGLLDKVLRQVRKPTGLLGQMMAHGMNRTHNARTDWGLQHVKVETDYTILDIGCGGGRTINKLINLAPEGKVYGIDYSPDSVKVAKTVNKKPIEQGRVDIQEGSVSSLPFPDNKFDLVTAIETHYYWPNLTSDLKEVLRVLKPGGLLLIVGGEYRGSKDDERDQKWAETIGMTLHTVKEFGQVLRNTGFSDVEMHENYDEGWFCGVGKK